LTFVPAIHAAVIYNNDFPNNAIGIGSRPSAAGKIETEGADDFILPTAAILDGATFTGVLVGTSPSITSVTVELYRVFPLDSNNPPSGNVPTRVNSPSDVAFASRDSIAPTLSFSTTNLGPITTVNSVLNGINKVPNQTTGGEGPVQGQEVQFSVTFTSPLSVPADHYFFVPQVDVAGGEFFWLSGPRPAAVTPINPDLQGWIRNENLAPDWLRVGTDIVGPPVTGGPAPTFNFAFSVSGTLVPEPSTFGVMALGVLALFRIRRKQER